MKDRIAHPYVEQTAREIEQLQPEPLTVEAADEDYWMSHRPGAPDRSMPVHDLTQGFPADVYTHPHYYGDTGDPAFSKSHAQLKAVRGKPEGMVHVFRALPAEHAHSGIRTGDWVALSQEAARRHGTHPTDADQDWPVLHALVSAKHLFTDADDLTEAGYHGPHIKTPNTVYPGGREQQVKPDEHGVLWKHAARGRFTHFILGDDPVQAREDILRLASSRRTRYSNLRPRLASSSTPYDRARLHDLISAGGFTHHPLHDDAPADGYSVSVHPDNGGVAAQHHISTMTSQDIAQHRRAISGLVRNGHHGAKVYQGGWLDHSTGDVYLDTSHVVPHEAQARELGIHHKQLAYYDLGHKEETYFDPTRDADFHAGKPAAIKKYAAIAEKFGDVTPRGYHEYEHEYAPHPFAAEHEQAERTAKMIARAKRTIARALAAREAVQAAPEGLRFESEDIETGGSKHPIRTHLRAIHPEHGQVGTLLYYPPKRGNGRIAIDNLHVENDQRRQGIGSALMDEVQRRHPDASIDHGDRTNDGASWWSGYADGKTVRRGRTAAIQQLHRGVMVETDPHELLEAHDNGGMAAVHQHLIDRVTRPQPTWNNPHPESEGLGTHWTSRREVAEQFAHGLYHHTPNSQATIHINGYGTEMHVPVVLHGHIDPEHHVSDPEELRGAMVEGHGWKGLTHKDEQETLVRAGAPVRVSGISAALPSHPGWIDDLRQHVEEDGPDPGDSPHHWQSIGGEGHHVARFTPDKRVFTHTCGLDHRLFIENGQLRPEARTYILASVNTMWSGLYREWAKWARVYFAGSEASEWTSDTLEGNNDFDVLIGVDYDEFRAANPEYSEWTNQQITDQMNAGFRDHNGPVTLSIDGTLYGPFDRTTYVNPDSYDITAIKPYAAYDVGADRWIVRPPHLPHWSLDEIPHAAQMVLRASESYAKKVLALPEPERTQEGNRLFQDWHSNRSEAFGPRGEGWWDIANLREKWLDQEGLWAELVDCAHRAKQGLDLAPADWSSEHPFGLTAALYHWAPQSARADIAEHGLDATRAPGETDPRSHAPKAIYFHRTRAAAEDMGSEGVSRTHDLYEVDHRGLSLKPDPYQPEDAVYTRQAVPPGKIKRVGSSQGDLFETLNSLGRREHPNVDHYQSSGYGHLEGDKDKSVVGFMPTDQMRRYREYFGNQLRSPERVQEIKNDIESGKGITNPLMVHYDDKAQWGYLGEGNHRLEAADQAGARTVPVRVVRDPNAGERREKGIGAPMRLQTEFANGRDRYVPTDIHPYHFIRPPQHEAKLPKTQKCKYCDEQATKRMIWAEGNAYVPVCDKHLGKAKDDVGHDEVCGVRPIKPRTGSVDDYTYQHRPPGPPRPDDYYDGGQPAHNLNFNRHGDQYEPDTGSRFPTRTLDDKADRATAHTLRSARGNPEHPVAMYRALPHEHAAEGFHTGDWVTLSKGYAQRHARANGGWPVVKATVPAKHLWTNGDYNEWGYHGPDVAGQTHTSGRA